MDMVDHRRYPFSCPSLGLGNRVVAMDAGGSPGYSIVRNTMKKRRLTAPSPEWLGVYYWIVPSPVGRLLLVGSQKGLRILQFQDGANPLPLHPGWQKMRRPFHKVLEQLKQYFAGSRVRFQIRLDLQGTPFQIKVWQALLSIPYGRTMSYGEIAEQIGHPRASRAVGSANGKNPVSIIVPCHRVIGSTGRLVGFGGGLGIKKALLTHECSGRHGAIHFRKRELPCFSTSPQMDILWDG